MRASQAHNAALKTWFNDKWVKHMKRMTQERPDVIIYDFFSDTHLRNYTGSIALTKYGVRVMGILYPLVSIESVVVAVKDKGYGKMMVEFAKMIVMSDCNNITRGYLVAQCLEIDFWAGTFESTFDAKAIVLQLTMLNPKTYHIEENCEMRSFVVESDNDKESPAKKLVP